MPYQAKHQNIIKKPSELKIKPGMTIKYIWNKTDSMKKDKISVLIVP